MPYLNRRSWSDRHLEQAKNILRKNAHLLIKFPEADKEQDIKQATDILMDVGIGSIAIRARHGTNFRDLTIRTQSWGDHKNEIDKLREGYVKWYLYMWFDCDEDCDGQNCTPVDYLLVDVDKLRMTEVLNDSYIKPKEIVNKDGETSFYPIDLHDIVDCIVDTTLYDR